jgi:hypothetical protein
MPIPSRESRFPPSHERKSGATEMDCTPAPCGLGQQNSFEDTSASAENISAGKVYDLFDRVRSGLGQQNSFEDTSASAENISAGKVYDLFDRVRSGTDGIAKLSVRPTKTKSG